MVFCANSRQIGDMPRLPQMGTAAIRSLSIVAPTIFSGPRFPGAPSWTMGRSFQKG